jgi:hypothetical protein
MARLGAGMISIVVATVLGVTSVSGQEKQSESVAILEDYASCGLNSLFLTCRLVGVNIELRELNAILGPAAADGAHSFTQLANAASAIGFYPVGLKVNRTELFKLPMPAIVQVRYRYGQETPHLLVLLRCTADGVYLLDAPHPHSFDSWESFEATWTGNVLVFAADGTGQQMLRDHFDLTNKIRTGTWTLLLAGVGLVAFLAFWQFVRSVQRAPGALRTAIVTQIRKFATRRNFIWYLLILLVVGIGVTYLVVRLYAPRSGPCLVPAKNVVDFGELAGGEQKVECVIRNDGTEPLDLTTASSNCSCAKVDSLPAGIGPSESGVVHLTLQVTPGPRSAKIILQSNDPRGGVVVRLTWFGSAQPMVFPAQLAGNGLPLTSVYERTVKLVYPGGKSRIVPIVKKCECESPLVQVQIGENNPEAFQFRDKAAPLNTLGELELSVRVLPPPTPSRVQTMCKLTVKYGEDEYPLRFLIDLNFSGDVILETDRIVFAASNSSDLIRQKRHIGLRTRDKNTGVNVVECPDWLSCQISNDNGQTVLAIELKKLPSPNGLTSGVVYLATDKKGQAPVPIYVNVFAFDQK